MRLRHSQDRGSGRPDEVVAAIGDGLGIAGPTAAAAAEKPDPPGVVVVGRDDRPGRGIEIGLSVRERLWLAGELEPAPDEGAGSRRGAASDD